MTAAQVRRQFEGWFATSFWVDVHYLFAAIGTAVVIGDYIFAQRFNTTFAGFVASTWVTATANDRVNMPAVKE